MPILLRHGTVRTRRVHKCHGCRRDIPIGERVEACACVTDGVACTLYTCAACTELFATLPADSFDMDEGVPQGWASAQNLADLHEIS